MIRPWLVWLAIVLIALAVAGVVSLWTAGRYARRRRGKPATALPVAEDVTVLDRLLAPLVRAHPGRSGLRLVPDSAEALSLRLAMAGAAERSLDLMYYIWEDDLSGRMLAGAALAAADRGVRVRMLIDDVNLIRRDPAYRALDRHPRIEVRLFNPIRNRDRGIRRGLELLFNLMPYNRRMHNKLFIADGRLAVTGGRNIGDAYFGIERGRGIHFDDLDVLAAGPVLRSMSDLFDRFWNSGSALPLRGLGFGKSSRLRRFRQRLARYLGEPANRARLESLAMPEPGPEVLGLDRLRWTPSLAFLGDPPEKSLGTRRDGWLPSALLPILRSARHELRIMTPYLVPGIEGMAELVALARSGVDIEIITNGLGRSDSMLVYGAYRWYRPRLLAAGIRLVESAHPEQPDTMMHGKAFLVDGQRAFVGSFNFDLRSAFLNTEVGVTFEDAELIAGLTGILDAASAPRRGWRVSREGRLLRWTRGDETTRMEPGTNAWKRVLTFLIGHLPIHRFL